MRPGDGTSRHAGGAVVAPLFSWGLDRLSEGTGMNARSQRKGEDRLHVRPSPPSERRGPGGRRFVTRVLRAASRAGSRGAGGGRGRRGDSFGRGRASGPAFASGRSDPRARRAVVKSRYVRLGRTGSAAAAAAHLRYIERDGTTRGGERGRAYGPDTEVADLRAFQ